MVSLVNLAEQGWLSDSLIRLGIRRLLQRRLADETFLRRSADPDLWHDRFGQGPLCIETQAANAQHYEVPTPFYLRVLGPHLKYSCGWWDGPESTLASSEARMLAVTAERARLANGQSVLDLGCGWGSFSLWAAARFPTSQFLAISNSQTQREFIMEQARARSLSNLRVETHNVSQLRLTQKFDRIVSVEMFEHMRNYRQLLASLAQWLTPTGHLFAHIFCHRTMAYEFEQAGASDWMARHFFSGGTMPARDLLRQFSQHLQVVEQWDVSGIHYQRTCEAWLQNLDAHREELLDVLRTSPNPSSARIQLQRWRMFFLACSELFGYRGGDEWFVTHLLWKPTTLAS